MSAKYRLRVNGIGGVDLTPDGRVVVALADDARRVVAIETACGRETIHELPAEGIGQVAVSDDGRWLAVPEASGVSVYERGSSTIAGHIAGSAARFAGGALLVASATPDGPSILAVDVPSGLARRGAVDIVGRDGLELIFLRVAQANMAFLDALSRDAATVHCLMLRGGSISEDLRRRVAGETGWAVSRNEKWLITQYRERGIRVRDLSTPTVHREINEPFEDDHVLHRPPSFVQNDVLLVSTLRNRLLLLDVCGGSFLAELCFSGGKQSTLLEARAFANSGHQGEQGSGLRWIDCFEHHVVCVGEQEIEVVELPALDRRIYDQRK